MNKVDLRTIQPDAYSQLEISPQKSGWFLLTVHNCHEETARWTDLSISISRKQTDDLIFYLRRQAPDAEQGAGAVAWMGYWPGAGSVNSITETTHRQHIADSWRDQGAEITPLVACAPTPGIGG